MSTTGNNSFGDILVGFFACLLAVPLFIFAHHQLPLADWPFHFDRVTLFFVIVALLILVLRLFKTVITIAFIGVMLWLGYGTFAGKYGFTQVYNDGRAFMYSLKNNPSLEKIISKDSSSVPFQGELIGAIDYQNPIVRDFAVAATNEFFKKEQQEDNYYRVPIQCFAVFKKINSGWNYVNDPQGGEYFAKASESVKLLAGDCDDHAVLMAACVKAIGGKPRLVHTTGHIYPELLIGNRHDLEHLNYLIKEKLFPLESKGHDLHYHEDKNGIWLNLDYTRHYPGGDFMAEPVLGILYP